VREAASRPRTPHTDSRIARRIRTGIVHVGDQSVGVESQAPFGGFAASGYGSFGRRRGIETFSNTR
jgi:vanillin dehydrogenase